jgi:uncharacterized protein (DUF2236 family)
MDSYLGWKIDFANPPGAPALVAPDSVSWRVYKNPIALGVGGIAAVLLEFADARIRSGVWDHSTFKVDPIGRATRTGMAAMVGVYGPESAARRVIAGVTNMHTRVEGKTPNGEAYRALDVELLDWVSATAGYGFLTAYDRFVARVPEADKLRFYAEGAPVARLYGVQNPLQSDAHFMQMMAHLAPRFEPHQIVHDFLHIIETKPVSRGVPTFAQKPIARAAVSILPPLVQEKLGLAQDYKLGAMDTALLRLAGAAADRVCIPGSPAAQASKRLGLPGDFLYRSAGAQARLLAERELGESTAAARLAPPAA